MYIYTNLTIPGYNYNGYSINYSEHGWANYTLEGMFRNQFEMQNIKMLIRVKWRLINQSWILIILWCMQMYSMIMKHTDKDFLTKQIEYNKEIMQKLQNCQLPLDLMFQSVWKRRLQSMISWIWKYSMQTMISLCSNTCW